MTFPVFCCCLEGCRLDAEDSGDGLLRIAGPVDGVPEAEEKWCHQHLAALLASEHLIQLEYRTVLNTPDNPAQH